MMKKFKLFAEELNPQLSNRKSIFKINFLFIYYMLYICVGVGVGVSVSRERDCVSMSGSGDLGGVY